MVRLISLLTTSMSWLLHHVPIYGRGKGTRTLILKFKRLVLYAYKLCPHGADRRTLTLNLSSTNGTLLQLSYAGVKFGRGEGT